MKKNKGDKPIKSILKAISWRVTATVTTMALVFIFTGNITLALEIGFLEVILKILFFYVHERVWNGTKWGKY